MITLVIVKNPFRPQDGREIHNISYSGTLGELLEEHKMPGVELSSTVNGCVVDKNYVINDGDFVIIYPSVEKGGDKGGKGILGIVAAIALSVVSFGIVSGGWLASSGFFAAGHLGAYLAATAVMFVGSSLIGRLAGQQADVGAYNSQETDPTYSWGGVQTMEGQNNAVSLTYGKIKSGGQTIGKFVSTEDNDEYLNWLVAAGEGPLTITDIKLNDNSVSNFDSVTCEIRTGTNDQSIIPYFNDTYFTKNLSYHLTSTETWYTDSAQGTATEGLIFKFEFPGGLYHGNDDGSLSSNYVDIEVQYKKSSASYYFDYGTIRVTGNSRNAIRKEIRIDNLDAGEYNVRVQLVAVQYTDSVRDGKECYWNGITSIVYDDFVYPCQALIGIRAKATDQLNGSPSLTFLKERNKVWVYNPNTNQYVEKPANNPAWACYDLLHQARQLKNINTNNYEIEVRGAAKELMRYDDFAEWAAWCAEKEYYVNIEINTVGELLEIANQKIAPIGHGLVVRFGTKYGCIYNHVQTPVQMFGMGNIVEGSFNEEFLKVSDRANCVEITFNNADAGYERDILTIFGETYDSDGYAKTAQMTMDGITDYKQAYREGMYQLYSNKYLLRTVTFTAGIDAIACTVGDVVLISHDVPRWANSGRIYSINGATWVLPVQITDLASSYTIQWRTQKDNLYMRNCSIVSSGNGWTTITVGGTIPSDDLPQAGDVFDLSVASVGSKPFLVKSINRAQDFTRTITCIEYNENIFDENYDIPQINYSQWYGEPKNVLNLKATLTQEYNSYGNYAKLHCTWDMPDNGNKFTVLISTDGITWKIGKSNVIESYCDIDVEADTIYWVKVITLLGINQSSGSVVGPVFPGGSYLPIATGLYGHTRYRGVKDGEYRYDIHLTWNPPALSNYQGCDIWYKTNHKQTEYMRMAQGVSVNQLGFSNNWEYAGSGYNDFVLNDVVYGDTYRFAVATKDTVGNKNPASVSPTVDVVAVSKSTIPNTPDGFSIQFTDVITVSWKEVSNSDIAFYEVRKDDRPGVDNANMLVRTNGLKTNLTLSQRTGTLFLYACSVGGKYSAPAILNYNKPAPPKPNPPQLTAKLGGFSLKADAIPSGCNGIEIYIDGYGITQVHIVNNTYTHTCDAGIYDVCIAYTDIFGEGDKSEENRVVVKATVDKALLESGAVSMEKCETAVQQALANGDYSKEQIVQLVAAMGDMEGGEHYTAFVQLVDALELRVKSGEIISKINMSPETITIDGKLLHVTGQTLFDNNVIVERMIQAAAITTDKLAAGAVTANKISVDNLAAISANVGTLSGGTLVGTRIQNAASNPTFSVDANGNIVGATLTAGSIDAAMITQAGFAVKSSVIASGTVSGNAGVVPLPSGYTEAQCLWAAYPTQLPTVHPTKPGYMLLTTTFYLSGRTVYYYGTYDSSYQMADPVNYYANCSYRIVGIK